MLSLDKENTTGSSTTGNSKSSVCSSLISTTATSTATTTTAATLASNLVATPKNSASNNKLHMTTGNTTGKRRALGDVANTTNWQAPSIMGVTPKVDRTVISARQLVGNEFKPSSIIKKLAMPKNVVEVVASNDDVTDYEPVERFAATKHDTFDDLFPEGRLSELLLNCCGSGKNINFAVRLPTSGKRRDQSPASLKPIRAKEKCEPHEKMKKIMAKMEMQETLVELDLPPLDDQPEPLIEMLHELTIF